MYNNLKNIAVILIKEMKDFFNENFKTLKKEIIRRYQEIKKNLPC